MYACEASYAADAYTTQASPTNPKEAHVPRAAILRMQD